MDHTESPIILRLKKATTELLLLSLLNETDMYGYQLATEIKQRSHELCACKETSLYPILNRLLEKDMVTTSNVVTEKKKIRVYYHLSETGKAYYENMKENYAIYIATVNHILKLEV